MKYLLKIQTLITTVALMVLLGGCATLPPMAVVSPEPAATIEASQNITTKPIHVSIAVGAPHVPVYLNFDLAQALGYFTEQGLDVELHYFEGGSDAAAALESGKVDFSGNTMDHVLEAQIAGQHLRMLMNFLDHPCATLVVRSDLAKAIASVQDLRGHKVGVTQLGSATHTLTVFVAAKAGVSASDFEVVEVGAAAMPDALANGTVDAAMGVPPYTTRLIASGKATVLVDLSSTGAGAGSDWRRSPVYRVADP